MNGTLLLVLAVGCVAVIAALLFAAWKLTSPPNPTVPQVQAPEPGRRGPARVIAGMRRRQAVVRPEENVAHEEEHIEHDNAATVGEEDNETEQRDVLQKRKGKKYEEKLRRKEEKRAANKEMADLREAKLVMEEKRREEQDKKNEEREKQEKAKEEAELKEKHEREQREQAEYSQWKGTIEIAGTGSKADDLGELDKRIDEFITLLTRQKVSSLEEIAAEFGIKPMDVVAKINELESAGTISGLIDDNGRFIHITEQELKGVASFIERRGRVSIGDIMSESNRLISLEPKPVAE